MYPRLQAPIVLAHGLFGFNQIGLGRLTLATYFRGIPEWLRAAGNRVLVPKVPPIAGIEARAKRLGEQIAAEFPDEPVHLIGHSMGGLDARMLQSDPAWSGRVLSLTTIGTPHLGSSIADFAQLKVGRVYRLLTALRIDHRGFLDVTRRNAREFHRAIAPPKDLPCFSIAGNPNAADVCWPLQRLHAAMIELEGPNDGLVSVESALAFGTPLPHWPVDHLRQTNWMVPDPTAEGAPSAVEFYAEAIANLARLGFAADDDATAGGGLLPIPDAPFTATSPSTPGDPSILQLQG
jgi:triacylglycerol lipase